VVTSQVRTLNLVSNSQRLLRLVVVVREEGLIFFNFLKRCTSTRRLSLARLESSQFTSAAGSKLLFTKSAGNTGSRGIRCICIVVVVTLPFLGGRDSGLPVDSLRVVFGNLVGGQDGNTIAVLDDPTATLKSVASLRAEVYSGRVVTTTVNFAVTVSWGIDVDDLTLSLAFHSIIVLGNLFQVERLLFERGLDSGRGTARRALAKT
jgi:hypothetical protein